MNLEQAKETLVDKIEQEFNVYKQQIISNLSKEEIISKAFEISMKDEIRYLISAFTLEKKEVQALLKTDNVLDILYKKSAEGKTNPLETFQDLVKEDISNIAEEFEKNYSKIEKEVAKDNTNLKQKQRKYERYLGKEINLWKILKQN